MTQYLFKPTSTTQFVEWHDPSVWAGGVYPNSVDADVTFPVVTTSSGNLYTSFVKIDAGETFAANSVSLQGDDLSLNGSLTINNAFQQSNLLLMGGGSITAGTLTSTAGIQGSGQITVGTANLGGSVLAVADTQTGGTPVDTLKIDATSLTNTGSMTASSNETLNVHVSSGGFTNLRQER